MSTYIDPFTALTTARQAREEELRRIRELRAAREFRMQTRFAREQEPPVTTRRSWVRLPVLRRHSRHAAPLAS